MDSQTRTIVAAAIVAIIVGAALGYVLYAQDEEAQTLRLATTTSTFDSGLLDYILPEFEDLYDCQVDVLAVGSGQAMQYGRDGNADILLVHSPAAEKEFVAQGYGESRTLVMYNNFVVVGPTADPAGTSDSNNATNAFARMHDNGTAGDVKFISRDDKSGTNTKELALWAKAGYNVSQFSSDWYVKASGSGMGQVLDMCEQMDAYTLSDDATYYQRSEADLTPHLNITYMGDPDLLNQYSVIPVNSTMFDWINHTLATAFKDWITSPEGQDLIASYERYGHQLFFPNAPSSAASIAGIPVESVRLLGNQVQDSAVQDGQQGSPLPGRLLWGGVDRQRTA